MEMLKTTFTQCQQLDVQLSIAATEEQRKTHAYFVNRCFIACEDGYNEAADFMAEALDAALGSKPTSVSMASDTAFRTSHLPQLNLPTFDGTMLHWESFRDRFRSMIHNDKSLSDVERLHYLYSCVTGEASQALSHLALTDANFDVAWNLLVARYENKRLLINVHLQTLTTLPQITSESAKDLRTLRDQTNAAIQALTNLERPVNTWDDILVFLLTQRLDKQSRKAWELKLGNATDYPSYPELDRFLDSRIRALDAISTATIIRDKKAEPASTKPSRAKTIPSCSATSNTLSCPVCKASHLLYQCNAFLEQSPSQRYDFIRKAKRCINCFSAKHIARDCPSSHSCKQCKMRHHSLLHFTEPAAQAPSHTSSDSAANPPASVVSHSLSEITAPEASVLLATARVRVYSTSGNFAPVRALLDQGSGATLVSESLAQRLRVSKIKKPLCITGVGETWTSVRHAAQICVTPATSSNPAFWTTALILKSLTKYAPSQCVRTTAWPHIDGLSLADPDPMSSDPIDIIIGADLYGSLLLEGLRKGATNKPIAQKTVLGWILSGPTAIPSPRSPTPVHVHHECVDTTAFDLRRFWELEEIPNKPHLTAEEAKCEEHFISTHSRTATGRYMVRLPFKDDVNIDLGDSRGIALSCLQRLERQFQRSPAKAVEYREFLSEYERLGHMKKVTEDNNKHVAKRYYIPHHAVYRDDSLTSGIRVVFNASCRSATGKSLNDCLLTGPKLQASLSAVILQWRQYRYVYIADIAKMYRQILLDPRDADYQRILWRENATDPVDEYQLLTVTYGTTSAPYQAMRVVQQLARDEGDKFPLALPVLRRQLYVDDCVFGANDIAVARQTREQVTALLQQGGLRLRKWASNTPILLNDIDQSDHGLACKTLKDDQSFKVLGIRWNPDTDIFQFHVTLSTIVATKRGMLSEISKFFDPLGWAAPVIIRAKILMQNLWAAKTEWDDPLPSEIHEQWNKYYEKLSHLNRVSIPRWIGLCSETVRYELHGFSDASMNAYAAVVYSRVIGPEGTTSVSLLTAKSRVAPVKTISIPRLELSAALLLTRLLQSVLTALEKPNIECHCWTDSSITLAWLNKSPAQWKTFVANRVAEIQTLLPNAVWHHVPTEDNPADCASRGLFADELLAHPLWWSGPPWLYDQTENWPNQAPTVNPDESLKEKRISAHSSTVTDTWDLASRFSSWPKLIRVTAYIMRFITVLRSRRTCAPRSLVKPTTRPKLLDPDEIVSAESYWYRTMQRNLFPAERSQLQNKLPLLKSSALVALDPYLDDKEVIRVGGRLRYAHIPEATKHPVVLRSHPLLSLIIEHCHRRAMHAGLSLTLASIRETYWILRARATVRAILHRCVPCTRERAAVPVELMGNLPEVRVNRASRAFLHSGIDYAGPILVRSAGGRGQKARKAYIAVFICMATKAIHLELVTDYSSAAFLAAFNRFVSRRGLPNSMYSDNGTTFQGADRELSEAYRLVVHDSDFLNRLSTDKISWHFLPPAAPHFGGLWEAAVKSVKHHLKRCIGSLTLTYEEFTTFLCRIEACLNSRPLTAMSDSFDDYQALTPGHFLIGAPLIAIPEPSVLDLAENRLSRWQIIQRLTESFWKSWSHTYLHTLQQRPKWRTVQRLAKIGQIVLLRNQLAPPSQWDLGKIIACHPGDDGLVRVVTVKTSRSQYTRPLSKLCFLPIDIATEESVDSVTAGGSNATDAPVQTI